MPEIISRATAVERGLRFMFDGKPCRKGHVAQRYVADGRSGRCVECWPLKTLRAPLKRQSGYHSKGKAEPVAEAAAPALDDGRKQPTWRDPGTRVTQARIDACINRIYGDAPHLRCAKVRQPRWHRCQA